MGGTKESSKEQRFWRSMVSKVPPRAKKPTPKETEDLTPDLDDLDVQQKAHRTEALKSMLVANETRQKHALRHRRPSMAIGETIAIVYGEHAGKLGSVLDADFITGRVQLAIERVKEPLWLPFKSVATRID